MGASYACCTSRDASEDLDVAPPSLRKAGSRLDCKSLGSDGDLWHFYDCIEASEEDIRRLFKECVEAAEEDMRRFCESVEAADADMRRFFYDCIEPADEGTAELSSRAAEVISLARAAWQRRSESHGESTRVLLQECFPELDAWLQPARANIILEGTHGDIKQAADRLEKAIECELCDRRLFQRQLSQQVCPVSVVGHDNEGRPVLFLSMQSLRVPLSELMDQLLLALHAARELAGEGQFSIVADMYGFSPSLFTDKQALQHLGERLSSVYTGRIKQVLLIDWSRLMNAAWYLVKPLLTERVQQRLGFVSQHEAQRIFASSLPSATAQHLALALQLAREGSSLERQLQHAHAAQ